VKAGHVLQRPHLRRRELARVPDFEPRIAQRPERDPAERHHRVAHRLAHPPHLAVAPFAQRQLDDRVAAARGVEPLHDADFRRGGAVAVERDAARQPVDRLRPGHTADAAAIHLRHLVARMRQPCGELAVVGQQEQAFGVVVEAPDRV